MHIDSVITGQLVVVNYAKYGTFYGVITDIFDDRYSILLSDGTKTYIITDEELMETMRGRDLVNIESIARPLYKNSQPVMSGKVVRKFLWMKKEYYTFIPA